MIEFDIKISDGFNSEWIDGIFVESRERAAELAMEVTEIEGGKPALWAKHEVIDGHGISTEGYF